MNPYEGLPPAPPPAPPKNDDSEMMLRLNIRCHQLQSKVEELHAEITSLKESMCPNHPDLTGVDCPPEVALAKSETVRNRLVEALKNIMEEAGEFTGCYEIAKKAIEESDQF